MEVRDKQKEATFSGDVRVKQGDTGMRCKSLVVFYEQGGESADKSKTLQAAAPVPAENNASSGSKLAAVSWSRRRIKPPPENSASST